MAFESRCGARLASSERNSPAMKKAVREKSVSDLQRHLRRWVANPLGKTPLASCNRRLRARLHGGCPWLRLSWTGLTFAFGEGGSKRVFAGVLFGAGMAIAPVLQGEAYGGNTNQQSASVIITDDPRTRAKALLLRHVPWRRGQERPSFPHRDAERRQR